MRDWLTPADGRWWVFPAATTLLALLAAGVVVAFWPWRTTPLLLDERRTVRASSVRRWLGALTPPLLALALVAAAGLLCWSPRRPCVVLLQSRLVQTRPDAWDDRVPQEYAALHRLDAAPWVEAVLGRARVAGAAGPLEATPAQRRELGRWCRDALLESRPPDGPPGDFAALPPWVVESVEWTVLAGLTQKYNARWVGVRVSTESREWRLAERLGGRVPWEVFADEPARSLRVRQLFNGRRAIGGAVRVHALVGGLIGASGTVEVTLLGSDGSVVGTLSKPVTLSRPTEAVELTGTAAGASSAVAEGGAARAPLVENPRPPVAVVVTGDSAAELTAALNEWQKVPGWGEFRERHGWPALAPAANGPVTFAYSQGEACLRAHATGLPAGAAVQREPFPASKLPVFGVRVAFATLPSDVGSFMSVAVRRGGEIPVPAGVARLSGTVLDGDLEDGRLLRPGAGGESVAVVEEVEGGVLVRLDLRAQGLLGPSPAADASRSRAFLGALCWAVESIATPKGAPEAPSGPAPAMALSREERDELARDAVRPTDALALGVAGVFLAFCLARGFRVARAGAILSNRPR